MQRNKLTEKEKNEAFDLYKSGKSYIQIYEITGISSNTLTKMFGGYRSRSECMFIARNNGRWKLSENGRKKLSESGIKSCIRSGKFWTKPERLFRDILLEIGIGVKYPEYIKEIKKVEDDKLEKKLCYQYPIQRYVLDYVDIENKVAININGDYWHSNPILYQQDQLNKQQIANLRQDKNKKIFLEKNGWKILDVWESEIYWNKELVKDKIRAVSLTEKHIVYTDKSGVQLPYCPSDWSETLSKLWFKKPSIPKIIQQRKTSIKKEAKKITKNCLNLKCRKEFQVCRYNIKRKYCCVTCYRIATRKIERPTKEELEKLISSTSLTTIGRQYGVSGNAVKKWSKKYGIEIKNIMVFPKNFNKYSLTLGS